MKPVLQSVLDPGGPDAQLLSQLSWILIIGAALVFAVVMALLAFAIARRRSDRRRLPLGAPEPPHARHWLLIAGAGIPAALLLALLAFSVWQTGLLTAPSSRTPLRITVIAHMWWWEVRYYDASTGLEAVTANELHIPTGTPVYLALTSSDVIHAFWLPSLAGKMDMLPGRMHGLTLRVDSPGVYRGQCAEYCGAQHANMALHLTAQPPDAFAAWLVHQSTPAAAPPDATRTASAAGRVGASSQDAAAATARMQLALAGGGPASVGAIAAPEPAPAGERGRRAFEAARCTACHSVRGLDAQPGQGAPAAPDLTHIGSRATIAAGTLPMNRAMLAAWIADPQSIKPGARMPSASISAESVNDIAAWLESLK